MADFPGYPYFDGYPYSPTAGSLDDHAFSSRREKHVGMFEPRKIETGDAAGQGYAVLQYNGGVISSDPGNPYVIEAQRAWEYQQLAARVPQMQALPIQPPPRHQLDPRELRYPDVQAGWLEMPLNPNPVGLEAYRNEMRNSSKKASAYGVAYAVDQPPVSRRPMPAANQSMSLPAYNVADYFKPPVVYNTSAEPKPRSDIDGRRNARAGGSNAIDVDIESIRQNCRFPAGNCVEYVTIPPLLERGYRHIVTHVTKKTGESMAACDRCRAYLRALVKQYEPAVIVDGASGIIYTTIHKRGHTISEGVPHAYYPMDVRRVVHGNAPAGSYYA